MSHKAISVPPTLKEALQPGEEATVEITDVRIMKDVWTSIGTQELALGINVKHDNEEYSQMFSLDAKVLTGSIGRLLVDAGIKEFNDKDIEKKAEVFVGRKVLVKNRGGKLYWYP